MSKAFRTSLAALLAVCLFGCVARPAGLTFSERKATANPAQSEAKLARYMDAVSASLDSRPRSALGGVNGTARQLLALRGYLRSEANLGAKWSWTAEEIKRFENSAEYRAALGEVEKVKRKFAEQNPGYELYVNTQVRTLEKQIRFWNETASVRKAADALLASALRELSHPAYGDSPSAAGVKKFRQFLKSATLVTPPTVATPGLSQHGQLRAFDFQVQRGNQLVAGTDSSSIRPVWEGQGWERKLKQAVASASSKFKGPLAAPREPWHYDYVP
ncbi:MAG TPA: hypothetical protein VD861_19420 [Pyrinomonadaceae bacterium]|nr:hypothetical protein [Pyrinomonadaceae bacterium]